MEYPDNSMVRLDNATISGTNLLIYGNGNKISGNHSTIHGDGNWVLGRNATVCGNRNTVSAWTSTVYGNHNKVDGMYAQVHGTGNCLTGIHSRAHGPNNSVSIFSMSSYGVSNVATALPPTTASDPTSTAVNRFGLPDRFGLPRQDAATTVRSSSNINTAAAPAPRFSQLPYHRPTRRAARIPAAQSIRRRLMAHVKPPATMIQLHLRGSDEESKVDEEACLICADNQRVVMSTCCAAISSCVTCAKKMYTNQAVGDVKCMLCQAPVKDVYRVS
jgi:hypothetical protein